MSSVDFSPTFSYFNHEQYISSTNKSFPCVNNSSNNICQNIRISVSSSAYDNKLIEQIPKKFNDDQQTFNHRPLYQFINENSRPLSPENNSQKQQPISSVSPSRILPPKQFSPFKPIILKKKSQVRSSFSSFRKEKMRFHLGTNWSI